MELETRTKYQVIFAIGIMIGVSLTVLGYNIEDPSNIDETKYPREGMSCFPSKYHFNYLEPGDNFSHPTVEVKPRGEQSGG